MESSTNSTSSSPLPSAELRYFAAILFFLLSMVVFVCYSLIFAAILKNREQFSSPYFKFIISLGCAEIINSFYYGLFGATCNFLGGPENTLTNFLITGILWGCWGVEIISDLLIAVDRTTALCFYPHYQFLFTRKVTAILIAISWLLGAIYGSPVSSLTVPYFYDVKKFSLQPELSSSHVDLLGYIYLGVDVVVLGACMILYIVCMSYLYRHGRALSQTMAHRFSEGRRSLMIQGFLHFSIVLFNEVTFWSLIMVGADLVLWQSFLSTLLYMLIPISNVVITLSLNGKIRGCVLDILRGRVRQQGGRRYQDIRIDALHNGGLVQ